MGNVEVYQIKFSHCKYISNREKFVKLLKAGLLNREIARELGINMDTVVKWKHKFRAEKLRKAERGKNGKRRSLSTRTV